MTKDLYFAKPEQIRKTNTNNPIEKKKVQDLNTSLKKPIKSGNL